MVTRQNRSGDLLGACEREAGRCRVIGRNVLPIWATFDRVASVKLDLRTRLRSRSLISCTCEGAGHRLCAGAPYKSDANRAPHNRHNQTARTGAFPMQPMRENCGGTLSERISARMQNATGRKKIGQSTSVLTNSYLWREILVPMEIKESVTAS